MQNLSETEFKLIRTVDPTKINVPIREKFAKLTLSSNKKKNELEKPKERQSASRNLLEQLQLSASSGGISKTETSKPAHINPLLRSDSSSTEPPDELDETCLGETEEGFKQTEFSDMEPLQISEDFRQCSDMEMALEELSQKVSTLNVNASSSACPKHIIAEQVSERDRKNSNPYLAQTVAQQVSEFTICVSSTSSGDNDDDAITISDSSLGEGPGNAVDYDLITSQIPQSGETADAFLPCTFSNERADRMEAFLRDVSQQRKIIKRAQDLVTKQIIQPGVAVLPLTNENVITEFATNQAILDVQTAIDSRIANADTETMSAVEENSEEGAYITSSVKREKRLLALDETAPMSEGHSSLFAMDSTEPTESPTTEDKNTRDEARKMSNDETELNTLTNNWTNFNDSTYSAQHISHFADDSTIHSPAKSTTAPEESLTIPETSSEADDFDRHTASSKGCTHSEEIVPSQQTATSDSDDSPIHPQLSKKQMSLCSINISAKINIKIQVSHQESSCDTSNEEQEQSEEGEHNDNNNVSIEVEPSLLASSSEENTKINEPCKQRQAKPYEEVPSLSALTKDMESDEEREEGDGNFMTHAEKLLNQLYGKAWQTPEVIRTLKRTGSARKNNTSSTKKTAHKKKINTISDVPKTVEKEVGEESALDDFSIFRSNIVQTNLDSTRLLTPRRPQINAKTTIVQASTEPRRAPKTLLNKHGNNAVFKMPQTENKARKITTTRSGRVINKRLLDDTDSEGENASDDQDADKTENDLLNASNSGSDRSWSKSSSSESGNAKSRRSKKTTQGNNTKRGSQRNGNKTSSQDNLIYLDLSKNEVTVLEDMPTSPPANNDEIFRSRLENILRTCRHEDKPKLTSTTPSVKSKRKLFNPESYDEIEREPLRDTPKRIIAASNDEDTENQLTELIPANFRILNKPLNAVKTGKPIFQLTPPRITNTPTGTPKTPKSNRGNEGKRLTEILCATPNFKYGFLKSLDVCAMKELCHPEALVYRESYRLKKENLTRILYDLYNEKLFNKELNVPVVWNKKLLNTAGRCLNKKKMGTRSCVVELSEKVLTSADRLRCTLVHELCHAATWIFNGEGGHGSTWKEWARKANTIFPELPKIGVCHQYDIEYKYTYKCTLCSAKSHAHSKSKKVENIRCSYCHGAIEIFINKKGKDGNIMSTPVREPTGFAKFVKENYKEHKRPDLKHTDIMKILSNEFAALKVMGN